MIDICHIAAGIGLETARALASAGASIVVTARSQTTADAVAADLRAGGAAGEVTAKQLELSDFSSVEAFARFLEGLPAIHVLALNAGERGHHCCSTMHGRAGAGLAAICMLMACLGCLLRALGACAKPR